MVLDWSKKRRLTPRKDKRPPLPSLAGDLQSLTTGPMPAMLYLEQWGNLTHGLTPSRLRAILDSADNGDITAQHQLFSDMEDRCEHLAAETGKRKRALLTLDWEILPGTPKDKEAARIADAVKELFDSIPGFEDLVMDMADGIGHGFAAQEITWGMEEGLHVPAAFTFRPQTWFQCARENRNILRLRDCSVDGAELWPFGWVIHTHPSKSGWLPRYGLFRVVAWAYLIRQYAQECGINYVQVHGLPLRLGKYPPGSSDADKKALMQALRYLGRDAAGIIPTGMEVVFETPATATQDIPGQLVTRCEQGMSKAILGGTLTSQADGKTSTNALGSVHNEVRHDLLVADAHQIASTISQQILAPLAWLNFGITERRLLPYFRFDTKQAADITAYADALPRLTPIMDISAEWAHDKLKIPRAKDDADILGGRMRQQGQDEDPGDDTPAKAHTSLGTAGAALAADSAGAVLRDSLPQKSFRVEAGDDALSQAAEAMLAPLIAELETGLTPQELQARLGELYPAMDDTQLADIMARALFVAEVWGRMNGKSPR